MLDFTNVGYYIKPTIKKVKLDLFNSFEDETINMSLIESNQQPISFLSLRQKYGIYENNRYPIPQKYQNIIDTMINIEMNCWKNKCCIQFTINEFLPQIIQVGQLLNLDNNLYKVKVIKNGIAIKHPFQDEIKNQIEEKSINNTNLPQIYQNRIEQIKEKLNKIVLTNHKQFLIDNNINDFEEFQQKFMIYHHEFNINSCPNIESIQFKKKILTQKQYQEYQQILNYIIEYYNKRNVSYMYIDIISNNISLKFNTSEELIQKIIKNLVQLFSDCMQINKYCINQQKWTLQIDKTELTSKYQTILDYLINL